jgi:chaperonin GroES
VEEVKGTMATATAIKLRPMGDRVVVRPAQQEQTTRSGIVLPDTSKEKPQRGEIVAAGKGRLNEDGDRVEMDVKVGDIVLFAKYAGTEFKHEDEDLLILSEKDILAIIED